MPVAIATIQKPISCDENEFIYSSKYADFTDCVEIHHDIIEYFFNKLPDNYHLSFNIDKYSYTIIENHKICRLIKEIDRLIKEIDKIEESIKFPIVLTTNDDRFYNYKSTTDSQDYELIELESNENIKLGVSSILILLNLIKNIFIKAGKNGTDVIFIGD